MDLEYKIAKPNSSLSPFVESIWMLANKTSEQKDVVVLPDGRFDIFFSVSSQEAFHVTISGLASEPSQSSIAPESVIFAISFKLLALEYLLDTTISSLLNKVSYLPSDFWGITARDLNDFGHFCNKVSEKMMELIRENVDEKKQRLFDLVYSSFGTLTVNEMSEAADWNSRQINRYFKQWIGISLKTYCLILKYRASFKQIKEGKLFPEHNFVDQAHFIKSVKKYSGVTPKELTKNKDDRFIQFLTLPGK